MTEEMRLRYKIVSLLLQFPDESFVASLGSIAEAAGMLPSEQSRLAIESVLAKMKAATLIELQEEYTRVFDLDPATSLYMTYHQFGNERKRGEALVWLSTLYKGKGCECASSELPDFLPVMLEFLTLAPEGTCMTLLKKFGAEIRALAARLKEATTLYAPLFDALEGIGKEAS